MLSFVTHARHFSHFEVCCWLRTVAAGIRERAAAGAANGGVAEGLSVKSGLHKVGEVWIEGWGVVEGTRY